MTELPTPTNAQRRGDGHQAGERAVEDHAEVGLAERAARPRRVDDRQPAAAAMLVFSATSAMAFGIDRHRAARIEPEPAEPEDQRAERRRRHVVAGDRPGLAVGGVLADARPKHDDARQRRPAADAVHDGRTGEVEEAHASTASRRPTPSGRRSDRSAPTRMNEKTMKLPNLMRSATAPLTIVAAVPANTSWKKNFA